MEHKSKRKAGESIVRGTYRLTPEAIDSISGLTEDCLRLLGIDRRSILRMRLVLEEVLLNCQSFFGQEKECELFFGKRWGKPFISLSVEGEMYNPVQQSSDMDDYTNRLLSSLGLNISFSYRRGTNRIYLRPKPPRVSTIRLILLMMLLAVISGAIVLNLPPAVGEAALAVVTPLSETFFRLISLVAIPMIFLSVICGIYNIGDAATLGTVGKRVLSRLMRSTLFVTLGGIACALPFLLSANMDGRVELTQLSSIYQMVLNIIPPNIVDPFSTGNTLQIIFVAVAIGVALLILKEETDVPVGFLTQMNTAITYIMGLVSDLVPIFIFLCIFKIIVSREGTKILECWKILAFVLVVSIGFVLLSALWVSVRKRVSLKKLIKKLLPTYLIGLTTASSAAAFDTNVNTCKKRLGMKNSYVDFCIPVGIVLYKPGASIHFISLSVFFALSYQVETSVMWVVTAILVVAILSVATPPVQGGALTSIAVLFSQLGIPSEALVMAMTLDIFLDFIGTPMCLSMLQLEMIQSADELGMIDLEVLRK